MILIDQIPLRREAEKKALKGLRETVKLRDTLVEYERQILPEYVRWETEVVGTLLTEEREVEAKLRELTRILEAVDYETLFYDTSPQAAYQEIMREMRKMEASQRRAEERAFEEEPRRRGWLLRKRARVSKLPSHGRRNRSRFPAEKRIQKTLCRIFRKNAVGKRCPAA